MSSCAALGRNTDGGEPRRASRSPLVGVDGGQGLTPEGAGRYYGKCRDRSNQTADGAASGGIFGTGGEFPDHCGRRAMMSEVRFVADDGDAGLRERLDEEISAFNAAVTG